MDLESVIQSEISQKKKNKYHTLMHIHIYVESRKMVQMNIFTGQEQTDRCREQICRPRVGGRGGGMNWKSRTDIYTLLCVKQIAHAKLLYSIGSPAQHSVKT